MASTSTMRAVDLNAYGGPEVLELVEVARPEPRAGEVLVRISAAGVNPADWRIRSGEVRRFGEPPFTLGLDLSGTVEAVGSNVSRFRRGDRVFGVAFPPHGSYAEYAAVPESSLAAAPAALDLAHAAALPVTGLTAWQALVRTAGVREGQRVLVHAAAGGVGHLAVQIAKAHGAYVVGTARSAHHAFLHDLGIDEVVDYTATDFTQEVSGIDIVVDPIGGDYGLRSLRVLAPGGILVDVRGTGPDRTELRERAQASGLRLVELGFTPSGTDLEDIAALVDRHALRVAVEQVLPLEAAARAHESSESGRTRGKIVLTVASTGTSRQEPEPASASASASGRSEPSRPTPKQEWLGRMDALWAEFDSYERDDFVAAVRALVDERPPGDALASYWMGSAYDSTGYEREAAPHYRDAFAAGLPDDLRRPATIQFASTLRNLGELKESTALLTAERTRGSDELDDALTAFLALALVDSGREREAVSLALSALAPHLTRYNRSLSNYARALLEE
ncbi:tetratricopeptide repeat protein [Streptomyces sp. NPDC058301]|uniref:tetratricopeptide repeat protein n=1 Tax=Streptomyces sp. NPDC058301 TaxID=3346436 RepID=UPI0036E6DADC